MATLTESIRRQLRQLKKDYGFTPVQMAEIFGVKKSMIHHVLSEANARSTEKNTRLSIRKIDAGLKRLGLIAEVTFRKQTDEDCN